jgi:polysaccharide pyruvyl transferase WcaK-like protein
MKTCVVSFFDSVNLGDLLIARSLQQFAAEFGSVERLSYSGDPFHFPDPAELPMGGAGPMLAPSLRARFVSTRTGNAAWRVKEHRSTRHARIQEALTRSDLLLLGGGNMIFDLEAWTRSSARFGYFTDTARRSGTPVFGISLGIGPFASARQHRDACRVLDRCGWLTFRDKSSLHLYLEHGRRPAEIGVDPVLLIEQAFDRPATTLNRLGWNLVEPRLIGGVGDADRRTILREHASAITKLVSDGCAVELFSTDRADELFLAELDMMVGSPLCRFRPMTGITALLELYREVDVVVASRMHALIVAFTQGVPVLGLSWQQKVRSLFDLLDRQGQCVSFVDLNMETLHAVINDVRAHPQKFAIDETDRARLQRLNAANRRIMGELSAASR